MGKLEDVLGGDLKSKQKSAVLAELVLGGEVTIAEFLGLSELESPINKGVCAVALKRISVVAPELLEPYMHQLTVCVSCDLPRVKWRIQEVIGNISKQFPQSVEQAVPGIVNNTKDISIVTRRCAAYGLTEIAKNNHKARTDLVPLIKSLVEEELDTSVKNVYLRALKLIEDESAL
jgi:hypothetical protein